jgi:DNA polymerase sigma
MDRRTQILSWIKEIIERNFDGIGYRAFIFGSQANSVQLKRSDIDVGIIADGPVSAQQLCNINNEIEQLPMLYKIDIIDFNGVDEKFRGAAYRNVEQL